MNVLIRADASTFIGMGHIMRCLVLAYELRNKGANVSFITRDFNGNLNDFICKKGFNLKIVQTFDNDGNQAGNNYNRLFGIDWQYDAQEVKNIISEFNYKINYLIVDHYALGYDWEASLRSSVEKIFVIDDFTNRLHDCDLLLNQNLYKNSNSLYEGLVPAHCRNIIGPQYALLRQEFHDKRINLQKHAGKVKRILIFFGGSDPTNETEKAINAVNLLQKKDIHVDIIVGGANPHKDKIRSICSLMHNATFYCQVSNIAEIMMKADLSLGAGGSSTWERCCLGLPAIVSILEKNQESLAREVNDYGAILNLGWAKSLKPEDYAQAILGLGNNDLKKMSGRGKDLVDGLGASRVLIAMENK